MIKVLLLGANGMLGQSIYRELVNDSRMAVITMARNKAGYEFDVLDDSRLKDCFESVKPDICINSIAIVNLSLCESNHRLAYDTNARLCSCLANLCQKYGAYYIHISTDHYYIDDGKLLHDENHPITLCNEYARTKYAGEKFAEVYDKSLILRTNIVGFRGNGKGETFLEWAIGSVAARKEITLFNDFFTSSISTALFSGIMHDAMEKKLTGTYNLASSTISSKEEFVLALSRKLFGTEPLYKTGSVRNIEGVDRANSLGLDVGKIESALGYAMPDLEKVLCSIKEECIARNLYGLQ